METILQKGIKKFELKIYGKFKPDKRFYEKVGINRIRFGQLLKAQKPMFVFEGLALSAFFDIPLEDLFNEKIHVNKKKETPLKNKSYYLKRSTETKTCKYCQKEFETNRLNKIFCSNECYKKQTYLKKTEA
jgi:hypothetical protein